MSILYDAATQDPPPFRFCICYECSNLHKALAEANESNADLHSKLEVSCLQYLVGFYLVLRLHHSVNSLPILFITTPIFSTPTGGE